MFARRPWRAKAAFVFHILIRGVYLSGIDIKLLQYTYPPDIREYLDKAAHLFHSLRDRGLMGLNAIVSSDYINETNNAILFLFRNSISYIDSLGCAASVPSIENMKLLARSYLEIKCYLEYILKENTLERAIAYQNSYIRERIKKYKMIDISTPEGKSFSEKWEKDRIFAKVKKLDYNTKNEIENLSRQLERSPFKEINERQMACGKNSKWYTFDCKKSSFSDLCEYLQCQVEYEFFYRIWSGTIHATTVYDDNIFRQNGKGRIEAIRSMEGFSELTTVLYPLIMEQYLDIFIKTNTAFYERHLRYYNNQYTKLRKDLDRYDIKGRLR